MRWWLRIEPLELFKPARVQSSFDPPQWRDKKLQVPCPRGASWQCGALQEASESRWEVALEEAELCQGCYPQSPREKGIYPLQGRHQVIDRTWRFLKDRVQINQNCRAGSAALRAKLRSAQYEYGHRNQDLWVATGALCSWEMTKFIQLADAHGEMTKFIQSAWSVLPENKGSRTSCVLLSGDLFLLSVMQTNVFHLCRGPYAILVLCRQLLVTIVVLCRQAVSSELLRLKQKNVQTCLRLANLLLQLVHAETCQESCCKVDLHVELPVPYLLKRHRFSQGIMFRVQATGYKIAKGRFWGG